ncbi:MAG: ATP-binding protein [Mariprofundus sp.]|nr:ATP-binding protein [Mariprofundus sp.]
MNSLKQRLTTSLAASLILFFIVQSFMISNEVVILSENNIISRLQHDQEQILSAITWSTTASDAEHAIPTLNPSAIPVIYQRPFSGHYFQIDFFDPGFADLDRSDPDRSAPDLSSLQLRSRSLWDEQLPATIDAIVKNVTGPKQQHLLVIFRTVQLHGRSAEIRVAEDISLIESSSAAFQRHFLLFAAAAVLALLVLQGWLINFSLKPLRRVREQLSLLDSGELELVTASTPEEITPLVTEVNRLIVLMRKRLMRSRHALGDLAHNLKTPLAVARQIAERQSKSDDRIQLDAQLQFIHERIESELVRARTAGPMPGGQWKDVQRDVQDIILMLRRAFPAISVELELDHQHPIAADREDMLEILGNLLENACKWGESNVRCSIAKNDAGDLLIVVEDDGPGLKPDQFEQLLTRGRRADENQAGHGLGLSIVNEMVQAYEGQINICRSVSLHGLQVSITIPGNPPSGRA